MIHHMDKHRIVYLYVGCMALFILLATSGFFLFLGHAQSPEDAEQTTQTFISDMAYVDLPRITVSLGDSANTQMSVDLSLEVARKDASIIENYQPQITDRLNLYFAALPPGQLGLPMQQASLRKEVLLQINKTKVPVVVYDLLFRQMLVR